MAKKKAKRSRRKAAPKKRKTAPKKKAKKKAKRTAKKTKLAKKKATRKAKRKPAKKKPAKKKVTRRTKRKPAAKRKVSTVARPTSYADVVVRDEGTIVMIMPATPRAKRWFKDNVQSESWQWLGPWLAIAPRTAGDLASGIIDAGLSVAKG